MKNSGLALTSDGATINKNPLVNCMAVCFAFAAMMLMKVFYAAEHLATGQSKDAEYLANQMIPLIRAMPDPKVVDLVICDGASDMVKFRALITAIFCWIWSIWCISHIANRIFAKIGEIAEVAELIRKGKLILDCFGGSKHFEHSLFESKCMEILHTRRALIRYVETRFGLYFVMLHRQLQLKDVLIACVTCSAWIALHSH